MLHENETSEHFLANHVHINLGRILDDNRDLPAKPNAVT